jgi:hypothetical protein
MQRHHGCASTGDIKMDDFFQKVTSMQDPFKKLGSYIPGFSGYVERQNRRDADKILRDTVARRFEEQWKRTSQMQADMADGSFVAMGSVVNEDTEPWMHYYGVPARRWQKEPRSVGEQ